MPRASLKCRKLSGSDDTKLEVCLYRRLKGEAIVLQSLSNNAVHLSLYKIFGNKTALCKYLSWSVVSRFWLSLLANNWYSVLHCFLTNFLLRESVNQTPRNLNETSGARGVL